MKKLAVIGANEPLECFYKQARKLGYYLIGIAYEKGAVCKKYCDVFYPISFMDKEAVLDVCRKEKIDGIISFSLESALSTVTYVAQSLNLVSNSYECLELTSTKYAQREAFKKNGICVPKYYLLKDKRDLLGIDITFPVILKPIDSGGSQGVIKVDNCDQLENAYNYAVKHSRTSSVIVEEFIDGREFSVEHISYEGKHYLLQITDKVTSGAPHFIEMQHHQPANIDTLLYRKIEDLVSRALDALQIENSASHTELKLNTKGELYIIEIGARMGGDFIASDLVYLSTGYDFVRGVIELSMGNFIKPELCQSKYSGVYFYSRLAPYVREYIENSMLYPEIKECQVTDEILPEVCSNADRGGYLIYQSEAGKWEINR